MATSGRPTRWSLWTWVTNTAVSARGGTPASTSRSTVARPASNWRAISPHRTSVPAPAQPGRGWGTPVPVRMTSVVIAGRSRRRRRRRRHRLVAPGADAVVAPVVGPRLGHPPAPVADLDLEPGRALHVEAERAVVVVAAQPVGERQAGGQRPVERPADVVELVGLDHHVVQRLGELERGAGDGQRVVAGVAVEEPDQEVDA